MTRSLPLLAGMLLALSATAQAAPADTVYLSPGESFTVTLDANPSTGYGWRAILPKDGAVRQVSLVDVPADTTGRPGIVGVPGTQVFTFKATGSTRATVLKMAYGRPWEKNVAPLATYELSIKPTHPTDAGTHTSAFYYTHPDRLLRFALPSNPSTGFTWKASLERTDRAVLDLVSQKYTDPKSKALGAPGQETFAFKAVGVGSTSASLVYARPGVQAARTHHVGVTVVK